MVDPDEPAATGDAAADVAPTTPPPGPEASRPGFLRRWARRLAIAGLVGVLGLCGLYLSRDALLHPALCRLAAWAGNRAGYEVRVGALRSNWWDDLAMEDVDVRAVGEDEVLRELLLDYARADFSLGPLLRGDIAGLRSVELGSGRLELDVRGGGAATDDTDEPSSFELPAELPPLTVESIQLRLETSEGALEVGGFGVRTTAGIHELLAGRVAWSGGVDVSGRAALALRWDGDRVEVRELEVAEVVRGGTGTVDISSLVEHGEVSTTFDLGLPADGRAEGRLSWADGRLDVELTDSSVVLGPTVAAAAAAGLPTPELENLEGVAAIRGALVVGSGELDFEARVTVDAHDLVYEARHVDELAARATIRVDGVEFAHVTARAGAQEVRATDTYLPYEDLPGGLRGSVQLDVDDLGHWLRPAEDAPELPPHRAVMSGLVEAGRVAGIEGTVQVAGGEVRVRDGALDLAEPSTGERQIGLDLEVDLPDLAALAALFGNEECSGSLTGDVHVDGPLAAPVGHARLAGESVALAGVRLGRVRLDAESEGNEVRVALIEAESENLHAKLTGSWDLNAESFRGARIEFEIRELEELGFDAGGSFAGLAMLDGPWFAPTGSLSVSGAGLAIGGTTLEDVAVDARAEEGQVTLERAQARTAYGSISATGLGTAERDGSATFELTAFEVESEGSDLRLAGPVQLTREDGRLELGRLELSGTAGRLGAGAEVVDGRWTGHVTSEGLRPDAFLRALLPAGASVGVLDLDLRVAEGAPLEFEGRVAELRIDPDAPDTEIDLRGRFASETVELDEFALALAGTRVLTANGRIPLPHLRPDDPLELETSSSFVRELPLSFFVRGEVARLAGETESSISLRGSWRRPEGSITLRVHDLTLTPAELAAPYLDEPASLDLELSLGERTELTRLDLELPARARVSATGALPVPLDLSRVARGDLEELLATALEGQGKVTFHDPAWARELLGARRLAGIIEGTATVAGTIGEPSLEGVLSLREGSLKYAGVPELEEVTIDLEVSENEVEVREARGLLGSSEVSLTGRAAREGSSVVLDLRLAGDNVLLQRSSHLRLRGDLALAVEGPLDELRLSGQVHLANSRILQQIDFLSLLDRRGGGVSSVRRGLVLPSFRSGVLATTQLDVGVDTREPIRLLGNVARGEVGLDLHVGGTGEVMIPTGTVFIDQGSVALPGGRMRFDSGLIFFREEDPYVPRLELSGEARLAGYDLEMRLEGPLDDLQVEPTTYPPLDRQAALLLVLTGQPPATGTGTATAAQSLGIYLAKDLARRWASDPTLSDEDREGLLSRLEIVSGQDVSRTGVMTFEVSYRAYEGVFRGDDDVFVVAERDVYEDYNLGLRFQFQKR